MIQNDKSGLKFKRKQKYGISKIQIPRRFIRDTTV